jgi:hypothetical protein
MRSGLFHDLLDAQQHFVELPAQSSQHQLLQQALPSLHTLGNLHEEAFCLSHQPGWLRPTSGDSVGSACPDAPGLWIAHAPDLQKSQFYGSCPIAQPGAGRSGHGCDFFMMGVSTGLPLS